MRYEAGIWARVEELKEDGLSDPEISRRTGISRSTIYMHFVRQRERSETQVAEDGAQAGGATPLVLAGAVALALAVLGWRRGSGEGRRPYVPC